MDEGKTRDVPVLYVGLTGIQPGERKIELGRGQHLHESRVLAGKGASVRAAWGAEYACALRASPQKHRTRQRKLVRPNSCNARIQKSRASSA